MKKAVLILACASALSSCIVGSTHYTTGNPVGTKVGYVKSKLAGDFDAGIAAAAKAGKITKIGSVDVKVYATGKFSVLVTGE